MDRVPLNVAFRRALGGDNLIAWFNLVAKATTVNLSYQRDMFIRKTNKNIIFSVSHVQSDYVWQCGTKEALYLEVENSVKN